MRRLSLLFTLPLIVLAVAFAVTNRHGVPLRLWPFHLELEAPLYVLVLGGVVIGLLVGFLAGWLGAGGARRRLRQERARADRLEAEVARLKRDQALLQPPLGGEPAAPPRPPLRLAGGRG